jgi:hypothetical protein
MSKIGTTEPLTEVIPVTNMVEVPILSEAERTEFIESIREAEADFREGRFEVFTADQFSAWVTKRAQDIRAKKRGRGV